MSYNVYYKKNKDEFIIFSFVLNTKVIYQIEFNDIVDKHNKKKLYDEYNIFNKEEYKDIIKNNTTVIFVFNSIYIDDTIDTIKRKIIKACHNNGFNTITMEELYLFCI